MPQRLPLVTSVADHALVWKVTMYLAVKDQPQWMKGGYY